MRNISTVLLVSSLLFASPVMVYAHGSGEQSHGAASFNDIIKKATEKVKSLVESGKLGKNWADVQYDSATTKGDEWVVKYKNDKESDPAKQTLYLFFGLDGAYSATNFTGK